MSYSVEIKSRAFANLEKLTPPMRDRVLRKIHWLVENFEQINPQSLQANSSGLFKLRIGNYRIIYSFERQARIITIHQIGHRREVYD